MFQIRYCFTALILGLAASMAQADPNFWKHEWPNTDFSKTNVPSWIEILSGGPPKDGIPALSDPTFRTASDESRIGDAEPVITLEINGV